MKVALKIAATLAGLAAAGAALYCLCYLPLRCNRIESNLEIATNSNWEAAARAVSDIRPVINARLALAEVAPCLGPCTRNANLYMIEAANYRILGRFDDAINAYRNALQYDRRPEIYFNLGLTQAEAGRSKDAVESLVMAGRSGGYWNLIGDQHLREEVTLKLFYAPAPRF